MRIGEGTRSAERELRDGERASAALGGSARDEGGKR
jgi:hypothetical protein